MLTDKKSRKDNFELSKNIFKDSKKLFKLEKKQEFRDRHSIYSTTKYFNDKCIETSKEINKVNRRMIERLRILRERRR